MSLPLDRVQFGFPISPFTKTTKRFRQGAFLKGPIPMAWLSRAGRCPGRALHVGVLVWHLQALKKSSKVSFSYKMANTFGVKRDASRRGLENLKKAGLIEVDRRQGRSPVVTLLNDTPCPPSFDTCD